MEVIMMEDSTAVTVTAHHPSSPLNENDEGEMDDSTLLLSLLDRDGNECPPSLPERELWSADALTRAWTAAVSEFKAYARVPPGTIPPSLGREQQLLASPLWYAPPAPKVQQQQQQRGSTHARPSTTRKRKSDEMTKYDHAEGPSVASSGSRPSNGRLAGEHGDGLVEDQTEGREDHDGQLDGVHSEQQDYGEDDMDEGVDDQDTAEKDVSPERTGLEEGKGEEDEEQEDSNPNIHNDYEGENGDAQDDYEGEEGEPYFNPAEYEAVTTLSTGRDQAIPAVAPSASTDTSNANQTSTARVEFPSPPSVTDAPPQDPALLTSQTPQEALQRALSAWYTAGYAAALYHVKSGMLPPP